MLDHEPDAETFAFENAAYRAWNQENPGQKRVENRARNILFNGGARVRVGITSRGESDLSNPGLWDGVLSG